MKCLYCGKETSVINSRHQKKANQVWRRRKCLTCQAVFTTIEATDTATALVVKDNDGLQPFSRDKLLISVYDSLKHRKTAAEDATGLTLTIVSLLQPKAQSASLSRADIVETVLTVLERFDKVAATHYLAFHQL